MPSTATKGQANVKSQQASEKASQADGKAIADGGENSQDKTVRRDEEKKGLLNADGVPFAVYYRISDRVCPAVVTDATTFGDNQKLTILYFDAKAAGRSLQVADVKQGTDNGCWWHSPEELKAAITYERKCRENDQT